MVIRTCQGPGCENEFEAVPINKKYCSITCKNLARRAGEVDSPYIGHPDGDDCEDPFGAYDEADQETLRELQTRNEFLRRETSRLHNLSVKYKNSQDEAFEAILNTIAKNVKSITVQKRKSISNSKAPELVLNPWNSDTQIGKVTPAYNTQIAYDRVATYTDHIIARYEELSGEFNITKAHVWFLGDIVEGENIFPSQAHLLDTSVFRQATVDGPQMYMDQIIRLLEIVDEVEVHCVIGNHGRLGRFTNPESNMDRVFYQTLYWIFLNEPRVKFVIPQGHGESMFWDVDRIGNYSTLLVHGDQFGPPTTRNTYEKKVLNWKTSGIPVHFDDVAMGHYHQNTKFTIGDTVVRIAGSTESHNTFAQERLGVMGRASQHLQFIDPEKGVYWESDVYLED